MALALLILAWPIGAASQPLAIVTNPGEDTVSAVESGLISVTATVSVGALPFGVAAHPSGTYFYITNLGDNTVSVLDREGPEVVATIGVGVAPLGVDFHPDGDTAYIANQFDDSVSVIDTASHSLTATIAVGSRPLAVALTPDGSQAWVTNFGDDSISVVDTASQAVVGTLSVGDGPLGIAVHPDGASIYVTCAGGASQAYARLLSGLQGRFTTTGFGGEPGFVSVIDRATMTVVDRIPVGSDPVGVAVHPDGEDAYVANSADNSVSVIDLATRTVTDTLAVGAHPTGIAVHPHGETIWVANNDDFDVSIIGRLSRRVVKSSRVGFFPYSLGEFFSPVTLSGAVAGMTLDSLRCRNRTAGTALRAEDLDRAWDCESLGLRAEPGDRIDVTVRGLARPDGLAAFVPTETGATPRFDLSRIHPGLELTEAREYGSDACQPSCHTLATFDPTGLFLYQTIETESGFTLQFIDTATRQVVDSMPLRREPFDIALHPNGSKLYVLSPREFDGEVESLTAIDLATKTVLEEVAVGAFGGVYALGSEPNGERVMVAIWNPVEGSYQLHAFDSTTLMLEQMASFHSSEPTSFAFDQARQRMYVGVADRTPENRNLLVVLNLKDDLTRLGEIALDGAPAALALAPSGERAFVADRENNQISVVDTLTGDRLADFGVPSDPSALQLDAEAGRLFVLARDDSSVSMFDAEAFDAIGMAELPSEPIDLTISSNGRWVAATLFPPTSSNRPAIGFLATSSHPVTHFGAAAAGAQGVAMSPAGTYAYFANQETGSLTFYDVIANVTRSVLPVGASAKAVVADPRGGLVFVADDVSGTVVFVDVRRRAIVAQVEVAAEPTAMTILPEGDRLYVSHVGSAEVSVVDVASRSFVTSIGVGAEPIGLAPHPSGDFVYVANSQGSTVSVIDTASETVVATIPDADRPWFVAAHPDGSRVYVSNRDAGTLTVIDTGSLEQVGEVSIGPEPSGLSFDPLSGRLHAIANGSSRIYVVDTQDDLPVGVAHLPAASEAFGDFTTRPPLGASAENLAVKRVVCRNHRTRQQVFTRSPGSSWSCEALGLDSEPEDPIEMRIVGSYSRP